MSRSTKKGPYLDPRIERKIDKALASNSNKPIKTWARASMISPRMVGMRFEVHNGKYFNEVYVTQSMVGHRLGEFSFTRKFAGHSKKGKIAKATGSTGRV